jgi:hypothetical protein
MKQTRKKTRKQARSPRKKEKRKRAAKALAAAGAIAGGTQAYAVPVRFENPAHGEPTHFHWAVPIGDNTRFLDLTLDANAQPGGSFTATTLGHGYSAAFGLIHNGAAAINVHTVGGYADLAPLSAGDLIQTGMQWDYSGYTYYAPYGSYLPEGEPTYLGARFDTGSGWQYAWIGVVRTGMQVETFAWGYETDPGVPIEAGAAPPPTGACCDDATATCSEDVTQADCEAAESRWGGDGSDCATIDPACVAGACCGPGPCQETTEVGCEVKPGWKYRGAGTTCEEAICADIPTVSEWGLFAMSLGLLAAGAWVVKKRIPQAKPPTA